MLCLNGFQLYSRWVPLTSDGQMPGVCPGRGDFEVLNQWAHKRQGQQY